MSPRHHYRQYFPNAAAEDDKGFEDLGLAISYGFTTYTGLDKFIQVPPPTFLAEHHAKREAKKQAKRQGKTQGDQTDPDTKSL